MWIVKVGVQYLSEVKAGMARCSPKQEDAIRFSDYLRAYRTAAKTFGLRESMFDDDGVSARVVRLKSKGRVAGGL